MYVLVDTYNEHTRTEQVPTQCPVRNQWILMTVYTENIVGDLFASINLCSSM